MKSLLFAPFVLCHILLVSQALAQNAPQKPVSVYVTPVVLTEFVDEVEALGTLQANENVLLAAISTGLVTAINFDDGQRVKKGDVLVQLDESEELADRAERQARVDEARRQVSRFEPLTIRGAASELNLDASRSELAAAKARLKAVDSRISRRQIIAPFDGVVGLRNISIGAVLQVGTSITTIDDDSVMKLDFSVPAIFLSTLKPGIKITATTSAYPGQIYEGKLSSIDSRLDSVTRSIQVRAIINNDKKELKPGLLMQVVLQKNPRKTLVVQEEAIISDGDKKYVLVAVPKNDDYLAQRRLIILGARRAGEAEILEGLEANELIITHGTLKVREGALVTIQAIEKNNETLEQLIKQKAESKQQREAKLQAKSAS